MMLAATAPYAAAKGGHATSQGGTSHSHAGASHSGAHGSADESAGSPSSHAAGAAHNPAHEYHQAPGGHSSSGQHRSTYAQGVERDTHGKIKRSEKARDDFRSQHPCPSTGKPSGSCPGYVIDHVQPLKKGGKDEPSNMQWQTEAAAKAKDKWE